MFEDGDVRVARKDVLRWHEVTGTANCYNHSLQQPAAVLNLKRTDEALEYVSFAIGLHADDGDSAR
jgi:hypothetical protein